MESYKEVEEAYRRLYICINTDRSPRSAQAHSERDKPTDRPTNQLTDRSIYRPTVKSTRWNGMHVIVKENWNDRAMYIMHNICIEFYNTTPKQSCDFYLLLITLHVHNRSKMELIMKKALIRRSNELWNRCIYVNFEWLSVDFVNA